MDGMDGRLNSQVSFKHVSICWLLFPNNIQNGNRFTDQAPRKGFRSNGRKPKKPRNRRLQLLQLANQYKEEHNPSFGH